LKGNTRHVQLVCQHKRIVIARQGMSEDIKLKLWTMLDILCCSIYVNVFVHKFLLQLHKQRLGSLITTLKLGRTTNSNYTSTEKWLELLYLHNIQEGRIKKINILGHIWVFYSAMDYGELNDKDTCIVENLYKGLFPKLFDEWFTKRYISLISTNTTINFHFLLKQRLNTLWKEIKELVKAKFIGIHRIANSIAKNFESDFRVKYYLSRNKIKDYRKIYEDHKNKKNPSKTATMKRKNPTSTHT